MYEKLFSQVYPQVFNEVIKAVQSARSTSE